MDIRLIKYMTYALRLNMILLMSITFGSFSMAQVQKSFAANIKTLAVIEQDMIYAKDLFDGLTYKSDTVIGPAPLPGKDMVLNARTLLRIAVALDLPWRPDNGMERIVVRRAATVIPSDIIEAALLKSFEQKGIKGHFEIIYSDSLPSLTLPQNESATVHVGSFDYDPSNQHFSAEIIAPSLSNPIKRQYVSGKIEKMISLPVLSRAIQNGQMISAADMEWIELPSYKVQHDYILDSNYLVGMTPRRMVMAGEPLKKNDVIEPLMVKRGERVTIAYQSGPIELLSEGKALQNGARGDLIRVVNYSSNRTIDAVIEQSGKVVVN